MAFGNGAVGLGGPSQADVVLRAQTGQFKVAINEARQLYTRTTASMSDASLRMAVAQEKLDRAIAKYGAESRQAKEETIRYRAEMRALEQQTERTDRETRQAERSLSRLSRGAVAGSGIFKGLGRSIAFASSGFLGGAGFVYGARRALNAASDLHEQTTKTEAVFRAASKQVISFANDALGQAKDQALETASTIGALLRPTGLVGDEAAKISIRLTKLGTDLSSFYNTNVADALTAIRSGLVGEVEPLRRYGVQLSAARVEALALADSGKQNAKQLTNEEKLLARIKIILRDTTVAHGDYAKTIGGSANQEREWQKNLRNTEALLGETLQPAYRNVLREVNAYLGNAENQKRIQEQVNRAVDAGGKVIRGLASGLRIVKAAAEPVVDALGGIEKAAELALIVGIAAKVRKAALGFGALMASSRLTAARGVADAAVFGRAWDVATRPRTLTVVERIGQYGTPIPNAPGRGGRFPNVPPILTSNPAIITAIAVATADNASGARTRAYDPKKYPRIARLLARIDAGEPLTQTERAALSEFQGRAISELTAAQLARLNANLAPQTAGAEGGDRGRPNQGRTVDTRRPRGSADGRTPTAKGGNGLSRIQTLELAAQHAELSKSRADDLSAARAIEEYYKSVASNEKLKGDKLYQARQDYLQAAQRTQSIEDQIAADRQAAADKATAARKAAQEKRAAAARKAAEDLARARKRDVEVIRRTLTQGPYATTSADFSRYGVAPGLARRPGSADNGATDALTAADLDRFLGDFLRTFDEHLRRYAPNFTGGLATHALEQLTRQQTDVLRQGVAANRFTEAPFLRRQMEAEFA